MSQISMGSDNVWLIPRELEKYAGCTNWKKNLDFLLLIQSYIWRTRLDHNFPKYWLDICAYSSHTSFEYKLFRCASPSQLLRRFERCHHRTSEEKAQFIVRSIGNMRITKRTVWVINILIYQRFHMLFRINKARKLRSNL